MSRISNNKISIYARIATKDSLEKFMTGIGEIKINGATIKARKLVDHERIILYNICPTIPHDTLLNELIKLGFQPISLM